MRSAGTVVSLGADTARRQPRVGAGVRLASTMMTASMVQFTVGALAPRIVGEEGLSAASLGFMISCYYLVAGVSSGRMGWLVGRIGGGRGLRLVVVLAIMACLTIALGPHTWGLATGLLLASLAVAAANPATNLAISQMPRPHGVLIGVKQSGFQLAAVVAGSVMPLAATLAGWRSAFGVGALLSVAVMASLHFSGSAAETSPYPTRAAPGRFNGELIAFGVYAFFMGVGTANANVYLVLFANEEVDLAPQVASALVVILGVTSVIARVGWNLFLESPPHPRFTQRTVLVTQSAVAVVAVGAIWVAQFGVGGLVWAGAAAMGLTAYAWNGVVNRGLVVRSDGDGQLGRDSGRVQSGFFFGLAAGPAVFAWLLHVTGGYAAGWSWSAIAFVLALCTCLFMRPTRGSVADI